MQLTITFEENVVQLQVYAEMEVENLIAYCEAEFGTSFEHLHLLHRNRSLSVVKKMTLNQLGVADGDMILVITEAMFDEGVREQNRQAAQNRNQSSQPASSGAGPSRVPTAEELMNMPEITKEEASKVRDLYLANPRESVNLKLSNLPLADALASGSLDEFHKVMNDQHKRRRDEQLRQLRMLTADPFDVEAQKMIADEIQRQNIESNMQDAVEFMPEAFGQVHMLYINCKVNGHPIKAFVDSGAQITTMSKGCAESCNITRILDNRWEGIARGVGTQKILGRIHMCQIQIEDTFLASSFNVLEDQPFDMLLGLDMLKRHQCVIDLKDNVLVIGTTGIKTRFLGESELPQHAKNNH